MNITVLDNCADIGNIDRTKLDLADKIISTIKPFIDKSLNKESSEEDNLSRRLQFKKNEISTKKEKLLKDSEQLKRQEKISILLKNIDKLNSLGVTDNTAFKNEIVILLKIIPKLNSDKLDKHINKISNIIKKRS